MARSVVHRNRTWGPGPGVDTVGFLATPVGVSLQTGYSLVLELAGGLREVRPREESREGTGKNGTRATPVDTLLPFMPLRVCLYLESCKALELIVVCDLKLYMYSIYSFTYCCYQIYLSPLVVCISCPLSLTQIHRELTHFLQCFLLSALLFPCISYNPLLQRLYHFVLEGQMCSSLFAHGQLMP